MMSAQPSFHDVHLSDAIQGVSATVREGVFTYKLFVSVEALRELGATEDSSSWLPTFLANEPVVAVAASAAHRKKPNAAAFLATLALSS